MTESSYLRYLPQVVREYAEDGGLDLGTMLTAFETMLTGPSGTADLSPGERIDRLHRVFDPWATDHDLLPWLASWVSFELPPAWQDDEFQQRRAVAEIAAVHAHRGRREGMARYLDLHSVSPLRPRIAIDDGARILFAHPRPGGPVPVHSLLASGPLVREGRVVLDGLVQPSCLALAPDRDLLLGDLGGSEQIGQIPAGVWRVDRSGQVQLAGVPPRPRRCGPAPWLPGGTQSDPERPRAPIAVAVDATSPGKLFLLDADSDDPATATAGRLMRLPLPGLDTVETTLATWQQLGLKRPVAMAYARKLGRLLVLDRPPTGSPTIVEIDPGSLAAAHPGHSLDQVITPLSLIVLDDGSVIVGDAGGSAPDAKADLVLIDPRESWSQQRLFEGLSAVDNPLVAPTAVVEEDPTRLLVLDAGLKPLRPHPSFPFFKTVARPATIHRVDRSTATPTITHACVPGRLVFPTGMVLHDGTLYICDPGEPERPDRPRRPWRAAEAEFGVLIHFGGLPPREPTSDQKKAIRVIREGVERIVAEQQPARALGSVITTTV